MKDDYYYTNYGQQESRYGYETKGQLDTTYTGYNSKPAGHQKIEYVVESHPVQVVSYDSGYAGKTGSYGSHDHHDHSTGYYSNSNNKGSYDRDGSAYSTNQQDYKKTGCKFIHWLIFTVIQR